LKGSLSLLKKIKEKYEHERILFPIKVTIANELFENLVDLKLASLKINWAIGSFL